MMSFELPVELWFHIFSFLALEDLCKARTVCRGWWNVINSDCLWKSKLLRRKITQDCVVEKTQSESRPAKGLENCEWADICFRYHGALLSNWGLLRFQRSECTASAEYVVIHMPYMVLTFDPYCVVEVQRLCQGKFVHWARFPLPKDREDGCFEPQMTSEDAFAVTKNGYTSIYKLRDGTFRFEIALAFSEDLSVVSCSNFEVISKFVRNSYENFQGFMVSLAVFKDVIWLHENFLQVVIIYDYLNCETKLRLNLRSDTHLCRQVNLQVYTAGSNVYLTRSGEVTIFSPHGQRKWTYSKVDASFSSFCSNAIGFGFVQKKSTGSKAIYINNAKVTLTNLKLARPLALALNDTGDVAYVLFLQDNALNIACASTETGNVLWESVIGRPLTVHDRNMDYYIEMRVILKKYIVLAGVNGFFAPGHVSVYSCDSGELICYHSFQPAKIVHMSSNFIVTRSRYPRGGMRLLFEVYNFMLPNE